MWRHQCLALYLCGGQCILKVGQVWTVQTFINAKTLFWQVTELVCYYPASGSPGLPKKNQKNNRRLACSWLRLKPTFDFFLKVKNVDIKQINLYIYISPVNDYTQIEQKINCITYIIMWTCREHCASIFIPVTSSAKGGENWPNKKIQKSSLNYWDFLSSHIWVIYFWQLFLLPLCSGDEVIMEGYPESNPFDGIEFLSRETTPRYHISR